MNKMSQFLRQGKFEVVFVSLIRKPENAAWALQQLCGAGM